MEVITIQSEAFQNLIGKLDTISNRLDNLEKEPGKLLVDNTDFIRLMNISKRTAQTWRDEGKITFSQVGSKIYYRMSDVDQFLLKHHRKAFHK